MAQQNVINAALLYKIGHSQHADPAAKLDYEMDVKRREEKRERLRNFLTSAGQMAINYWLQGQQYMRKLQEQQSPLVGELDLKSRSAGITHDLELHNNIQNYSDQLNEVNKTLKRWRYLPGSKKYKEAEAKRTEILYNIKSLSATVDGAATIEEQQAKYWTEAFGIGKSQEGFGSLVGRYGGGSYSHFERGEDGNIEQITKQQPWVGEDISVPEILGHNTEERIRNSAFFASGEWRNSSYLDEKTNEVMLVTPQGEMRLKDFVSMLAVPGDSKVNTTASTMKNELVAARYTSPYSVWESDYKSQLSDFVGNTQVMPENSYKTWFFTWKGFDGKSAAEVTLDDFIKNNVKGGVPGKVDDPATDIKEDELKFEWDGNMVTYLGALEQMKDLKFNTTESRQSGIDLYLKEIEKHHNNLHNQYVASQTKKENTGTGTGGGGGGSGSKDTTNWFTPGTYINIGGTSKEDRKSISAEKAEVLTDQLIEKGQSTITYEGVTYQWIPDYNVFAGDDGTVYGNIDDLLTKISPSGSFKNELIARGAYKDMVWEDGDVEGFNTAYTTEEEGEEEKKKKKKKGSRFGNWMQNIGVIPGGYESKVR
jgi:hypothetical protein